MTSHAALSRILRLSSIAALGALTFSCAEGTEITTGGSTEDTSSSAGGGTGDGGSTSTSSCTPHPEGCNNKDDDCDGVVDNPEDLDGKPCATGVPGACQMGLTSCESGVMTCTPTTPPGSQEEVCNGVDDDCNNVVDDLDANVSCPAELPDATDVATWVCGTGACAIMACGAGHSDLDKSVDNGCECATDTYASACSASASTAVAVGATVDMQGVIETSDGIDWITFTFADPGVGAAFHPRIELTDSVAGKYKMTVMVDCAGTAAGCSTTGTTDNENGINVTTWEQSYTGYTPGGGCCQDPTPRQTTVRVNITRANADPPGCDIYKVTASSL
ncbi:MAG TPA: hypothetical protein VL400_21755 [Polyangiaceae bacterium]|nr:hypothetical protein [Polyangiaceae bacterium]